MDKVPLTIKGFAALEEESAVRPPPEPPSGDLPPTEPLPTD